MHKRPRIISNAMKKTRIVFMGTPEFAVGCLEELHRKSYEVVGVVTAPDRPSGRGKKLRPSPVKRFAEEQAFPLLQPTQLKNPEFLNTLKAWKPDIIVVVAFRMLPKEVWQIPPLGTFNLHASLLPDYRGAAPINWALIQGEEHTGVTTFLIDEAIDTGAILLQEATPIDPSENAGHLHDRLLEMAKGLIPKTIDGLVLQKLKPKPQAQPPHHKPAPKLNRENTEIPWESSTPEQLMNHIRGLSPSPGAWTWFQEGTEEPIRIKVMKAHWILEKHEYDPLSWVVSHKKILVALTDGFLHLEQLQWPGKKIMQDRELLNGRSFGSQTRILTGI